MDCTLPVSSVCGILQARILEWVAIPFSRGSSQPKDQSWVFRTAGRFFMSEPPKEPIALEVVENIEIYRKRKWVYMYVKKPYVINPNGQGSSTCWRFSVAAEVIPLKAFGGFWNRVYYCGRDILIVLTEVISRIFGFDVINCQGKIYVIPTATEPGWNPRDKSRSLFNNELRSLSWFLLVPVQVIIHFLAGFAGDSDSVSWSHWHRCWRLCEGYICYSLYLREKIEKIIQNYHIQQEWQKLISYTNAFLGGQDSEEGSYFSYQRSRGAGRWGEPGSPWSWRDLHLWSVSSPSEPHTLYGLWDVEGLTYGSNMQIIWYVVVGRGGSVLMAKCETSCMSVVHGVIVIALLAFKRAVTKI